MKVASFLPSRIAFFAIIICQHSAMANLEFKEKLIGDAGSKESGNIYILPQGTTTIVGNVLDKRDTVDCYQYRTNKRTKGSVVYRQPPKKSTITVSGKANISSQGSCGMLRRTAGSNPLDYCIDMTFLAGETNICVHFNNSGAFQGQNEYRLDLYPPPIGPPRKVSDEKTMGDAAGYDLAAYGVDTTRVNTIVGTIGGYTGVGYYSEFDSLDCYRFAQPFDFKSGIIFKKQPPGARITQISHVPGTYARRDLNYTESVGSCSDDTGFAPAIPAQTTCISADFSERSFFCVELPSGNEEAEAQAYELFLTVPNNFDWTK